MLQPRVRRPWCGWAGLVAMACTAGCGGLVRNDNAEGVRLYQQGNYLGAVNHFQQALQQQPGSPDCFYNLGATYHQQAKLLGRPDDMRTAEQYYHLCLSRNPDHPACNRGLAVLMVETGRGGDAVALLDGWSRRRPADPEPQIELARLCQEHGDLREAETHLQSRDADATSHRINSLVISASLGNGRHIQLPSPVRVTLSHLNKNFTDPVCAFWDYELNGWSDAGCRIVTDDVTRDGVTVCECDHLTNFGLLMRPVTPDRATGASLSNSGSPINKSTVRVLEIVTYVAVALSLLFIVVIVYRVKTIDML